MAFTLPKVQPYYQLKLTDPIDKDIHVAAICHSSDKAGWVDYDKYLSIVKKALVLDKNENRGNVVFQFFKQPLIGSSYGAYLVEKALEIKTMVDYYNEDY